MAHFDLGGTDISVPAQAIVVRLAVVFDHRRPRAPINATGIHTRPPTPAPALRR